MAIILTNCTNRKRGVIVPSLDQDNLSSGSIESVASQWLALLRSAHAINPARDIYCGRSFREAEAASRALSCPLYVVSAGLGVVNSDLSVPVYNLTAIPNQSNSVLNKICGDISPQTWWSIISRANPFGSPLIQVLNNHSDGLILIALPRTYLELIRNEILQCTMSQQSRLRFFGKNLNVVLPSSLTKNWMPYDDRLDGVGFGHSGTQSDFAQRALRHFVLRILSPCADGDRNMHSSMVLKSLSSIVRPPPPKRQRLSDLEIGKAILDNWNLGKGQSSLLLHIIRHNLNIACEQSRFREIYRSVIKSRGDASEKTK